MAQSRRQGSTTNRGRDDRSSRDDYSERRGYQQQQDDDYEELDVDDYLLLWRRNMVLGGGPNRFSLHLVSIFPRG